MRVDLVNLYKNKIVNATFSVVNTTSTPKMYGVEIGIPLVLSYVNSKISKGIFGVSQKDRVAPFPGKEKLNYYTWSIGTLSPGQGASITVTVKVVEDVSSSYVEFEQEIIEISSQNLNIEIEKNSSQNARYKTMVLCIDEDNFISLPKNSDADCVNKLLNLVKSVKESVSQTGQYSVKLEFNEAVVAFEDYPFSGGSRVPGDSAIDRLRNSSRLRAFIIHESSFRKSIHLIILKNCNCFLIVLYGDTINLSEQYLLDYFNISKSVPSYEVKLVKDSCKTSEGVGVHLSETPSGNSIFFVNDTSHEASFSYSDGVNTFTIKVPPYIHYNPNGTGYGFYIPNNFFGNYIIIVNYISPENQNCKAEYIIKRK